MEIKNEALKSLYEDLVSDIWSFSIETAFKKCDDELQSSYDKEHSRWVELAENYDRLETKYRRLERENEDLKAKKDNVLAFYRIKQLEETNERLKSQLMETNDTLEKANRDRNDLRRQIGSLNTSLGRLRERYEEEVVCRRKWAKLAGYRDKRIEELLNTGYGIDADKVYKIKGMEELWSMLGEMFDVDYNNMLNIFGYGSINNIAHYTPDVRDFLKKYETWKSGQDEKEEEQKRLAYMRDYLHRFCVGKVCYGCPLNAPEFKCYEHGGFESISDEDLQRYYEKARGCGRFPWADKKEEKPSDEVPCSFNWKLDGAEYTIETSIPRKDYDNIVKIISGKE